MDDYITEKYHNVLINLIYLGLFTFIGGVLYLKDGGDMPRIFYLFILLPSLLLFPGIIKEFRFNDKYFILFVLFPIYLCLSFLWAADENVKKDFLFHLRNLFCVFSYVISLWFVMRRKSGFIRTLLLFLFFAGYLTSIISLIHYISVYGFTINKVLEGYFIHNSNKIGSMYSIHVCLSVFLMFYPHKFIERKIMFILLISALVLSCMVIYLSQAVVPWFIIAIFTVLITIRRMNWSNILILSFFISPVIFCLHYFGVFDSLIEMNRVQVRIQLVHQAIAQMEEKFLFGIGLVYKLPLFDYLHNRVRLHPHPHNIFVDCFRFGGAIVLILILVQCLLLVKIGIKLLRNNAEIGFVLFWFVTGIVVLSFYGQQPLVRPGGYLWFFYWTPGVLLLVKWTVDRGNLQREDS